MLAFWWEIVSKSSTKQLASLLMSHIRSDIMLSRDVLLGIYIDLHECNMIRTRQACR